MPLRRLVTDCRPVARRAVALLVTVTLLLPAVFVATEAKHDCTGDGCVVCQVLRGAIALQGTYGPTPSRPQMPLALPRAAALTVVVTQLLLMAETPITLKDRMDD